MVWADPANLMQLLLNLTTNIRRALSQRKQEALSVFARSDRHRILVEFINDGGDVVRTEQLFHPVRTGNQNTHRGFYLSRAFMLSFDRELRHKALPGSAFS